METVFSLSTLFSILARIINVFYLICFIRIILSWFPSIMYSNFGRFISQICDPYLNIFRSLKLQFAGLDFSPAIALGVLYIVQVVLSAFASVTRISFGVVLGMIISMLWSVIQMILVIFLVILIIRFIAVLLQRDLRHPFWDRIDYFVSSTCRKITRRNFMDYKWQLLITIIFLIAIIYLGSTFIPRLAFFCSRLAF